MNLGRPLDRVALALLRPIGRWAHVAMWSLAAAGVLGPAWLVPSNLVACLWLAGWGVFISVCWVRSLQRATVVVAYGQPRECLRIDDPFRRRTRKVFVIVTLLVLTRAPFLLALLASRPWLDHYAYYVWAVLPADVEPQTRPGFHGLLLVRWIEAAPTYVTFHLFGGGTVTYRPNPDGTSLECDWNTRQESF
jgi:hypothetical protein